MPEEEQAEAFAVFERARCALIAALEQCDAEPSSDPSDDDDAD